MKIVCAWCGKDMGEKDPTYGKWKDEVTHGMCAECYRKETGKERTRGGQDKNQTRG